jgi:folate-binding protein YgfZ
MPEYPFDIRDYTALSKGCGFVELEGWSSVTLTGGDRQPFLHNFCTNDVKRLAPDKNCEAFFPNVKGKIIGHGLITCRDAELVIIGPPGQGSALATHLERYVIREDVAIQDSTAERGYFLLAGGDAARGVALEVAPEIDAGGSSPCGLTNAAGLLGDIPVYRIRWNLLGSVFCRLIETNCANLECARQALADRHCQICDQAAFHALRIEAGTPLFGLDFDDRNLPQEVGRNEQAISFTKGCYLGQETVARIDALGHVNQQLAGVKFAGSDVPEAGTELAQSGKSAGRITSATVSPRLRAPLALAMLRRENASVGSRLESAAGSCEVISLPVTSTQF